MPDIVGVRNKNICNVKQGTTPWVGSIGTDSAGHAIFREWESSVRAAARSIEQKIRAGKNTIRKLCRSWAPVYDNNDPDRYAIFISSRMNWPIDEPLVIFKDGKLTLQGREQLAHLISAMGEYELFRGFQLPWETIMSGIAWFERDFLNADTP